MRFRQVLLSLTRDFDSPTGYRPQLEVLKKGQAGPRRVGVIQGEGVLLVGRQQPNDGAPCPIILDWLEEHPHLVVGLKPEVVLAAVEAVRVRGFWFV